MTTGELAGPSSGILIVCSFSLGSGTLIESVAFASETNVSCTARSTAAPSDAYEMMLTPWLCYPSITCLDFACSLLAERFSAMASAATIIVGIPTNGISIHQRCNCWYTIRIMI